MELLQRRYKVQFWVNLTDFILHYLLCPVTEVYDCQQAAAEAAGPL